MTETTINEKAKRAIIVRAMKKGNQIIYQDDDFIAEVEEHDDHIDVFIHRWFICDDVNDIDEIEEKLMTKKARRFHENGMLKTTMALEEHGYDAGNNIRSIPCIDFIVYKKGHNLALLVQHNNFQFEKEVE